MATRGTPRVAIACQGGGSHTAFTAGVLDRLLAEQAVDFEVVGLSGTSGGAICAFTAWYGIVSEEGRDGHEEARRLLAQVWADMAARDVVDRALNDWGLGAARAHGAGVPLPLFSPYDTPGSDWGRRVLRSTLEAAVNPDALAALVDEHQDPLPRLDVGAVDVQRGTFRTFDERTVSHDAVLASAAVPTLFQAAPVTLPDGTTRWYWDGLFSQNPPLGNLFRRAEERLDRAEELWIIQINPQREMDIPRDLDSIGNRRNELGGNLSVNQELGFIRRINEWAASGALAAGYDPIEVKTISLEESAVSPGRGLDYATKLDRSERFLDRLWNHGREQAERFLRNERNRRRVHEVLEASWTRDPAAIGEWAVPTFEAQIPTSLATLREGPDAEGMGGSTTLGRDEVVAFGQAFRRTITDLRYSVEELLAEGDAVATRWRATGTHSGELLGVEATGEPVTLSGMRIDHLEDGRFADTWLLFEEWNLLRQLEDAETPTSISTMGRVTPTPVVTQLSAPAENEALARALVTEVWNEGRRDSLDRLLGDDFVLYLANASDVTGPEAYWAFVQQYRRAFPDLALTIEDAVSEGDKIAIRLTLRGTHEGTVLGVEPTGTRVDVDRMVIHHVDDGRIIETGVVEDTLGLLEQLGSQP